MISPTILKVLQGHLDLLHDPDHPRNLDFYLSLPEKPDKGANGIAVGSPLLLYGMVLLLTGQPEWKLLIAKSIPWFEVELAEGNEPGRLCSAIERMVSASWVTGTPFPLVPGEMLPWVQRIDVPGYETRLPEAMLAALASGDLETGQWVQNRLWPGGLPQQPPGRWNDERIGVEVLAYLLGQKEIDPDLKRYLRKQVYNLFLRRSLADALQLAMLYHRVFTNDLQPQEVCRLLASTAEQVGT